MGDAFFPVGNFLRPCMICTYFNMERYNLETGFGLIVALALRANWSAIGMAVGVVVLSSFFTAVLVQVVLVVLFVPAAVSYDIIRRCSSSMIASSSGAAALCVLSTEAALLWLWRWWLVGNFICVTQWIPHSKKGTIVQHQYFLFILFFLKLCMIKVYVDRYDTSKHTSFKELSYICIEKRKW